MDIKGGGALVDNRKQAYLGGAAILAASVAITKIIGVIYKIPIYNLLGDEGSAHFQITYSIYSLLLTLSTAGVPIALSRLIAAASALNRPRQIRRYFYVGLAAFTVIGLVCMVIMLIFAQQLANFMGNPEVTSGVRALAPAVLFACVVSVYRGYSQGFSDMMPTAISQVMESAFKLIFGIVIAWLLSSRGYGSSDVAAGAIVGVTIGLGLAIPVLMLYKRKIDKSLHFGINAQKTVESYGGTLAQILKIGVPIMLSASILNIITLIDTKLVLTRLQSGAGFSYWDAKVLTGVYSKAQSLFAVPSSFIVPITVSIIPPIAAAIARRNSREAKLVMASSLKLTNIFALPAAVGLAVMAEPIFTSLFYGSNENGPVLLVLLGISSFFVCTQLMTNAILQASGHERLALITLPIGGLMKVAVNWFLVSNPAINILGAPIGTLCCYILITALNTGFISWKIKDHPAFFKLFIRPAVCAGVMGVCAYSIYGIFSRAASSIISSERIAVTVALIATIVLAAAVYFALIVLTRAVTKEDMKYVPKGEKLAKLLRIK